MSTTDLHRVGRTASRAMMQAQVDEITARFSSATRVNMPTQPGVLQRAPQPVDSAALSAAQHRALDRCLEELITDIPKELHNELQVTRPLCVP